MSEPQLQSSPTKSALRGYPNRYTDMMEQLQLSYVRAIAASAGCIVSKPEIDDGIDLTLTHKVDIHQGDKVARLEVQLKATSDYDEESKYVTATMRRDRWDYYRTPDCTINKIVVIMSMPKSQDEWTLAEHAGLSVRYCAYWVNLYRVEDSTAERPTVKAFKSNIFDDLALCEMMERIGQGGRP